MIDKSQYHTLINKVIDDSKPLIEAEIDKLPKLDFSFNCNSNCVSQADKPVKKCADGKPPKEGKECADVNQSKEGKKCADGKPPKEVKMCADGSNPGDVKK